MDKGLLNEEVDLILSLMSISSYVVHSTKETGNIHSTLRDHLGYTKNLEPPGCTYLDNRRFIMKLSVHFFAGLQEGSEKWRGICLWLENGYWQLRVTLTNASLLCLAWITDSYKSIIQICRLNTWLFWLFWSLTFGTLDDIKWPSAQPAPLPPHSSF